MEKTQKVLKHFEENLELTFENSLLKTEIKELLKLNIRLKLYLLGCSCCFMGLHIMTNKFKFKIDFTFRCDNGVVHHIETGEMELPHNDWWFRHKATVMAMNILLGMADYIKEGNKQLEDFKIIWEE